VVQVLAPEGDEDVALATPQVQPTVGTEDDVVLLILAERQRRPRVLHAGAVGFSNPLA
jgi:hypothetical protein